MGVCLKLIHMWLYPKPNNLLLWYVVGFLIILEIDIHLYHRMLFLLMLMVLNLINLFILFNQLLKYIYLNQNLSFLYNHFHLIISFLALNLSLLYHVYVILIILTKFMLTSKLLIFLKIYDVLINDGKVLLPSYNLILGIN